MAFDMDTVSPCSPLVLPCRTAHLVSFFYIPSRLAYRLVRLALRPAIPSRRLVLRLGVSSRPASRFHCLLVGYDTTFILAPFRLACRLPSRLAFRSAFLSVLVVLRLVSLRFCPACRYCVSSLRSVFLTHFARLRSSSLVSVRHPLVAFFLRRRFVLLFAHFYSFPAPLPGTLLSFPLFFFLICAFPVASRLSSRPLVSSCRLVLARPVRRPACRVVGSSRLFVSLVVLFWRRSVLLFARSRLVCRGVIALSLSCRLVGLGVPIYLSSRSCVPSAWLVSVVSFSSVISLCLIRGRLGFVFMPVPVFSPFRPACRSFLLAYLVSVPVDTVVGRDCALWSWGRHGLLLSSHPSLHRSCSLLALSLQDGSMGGDGDMGRRSMLLAAHPLPGHAPSFLLSHRLIAPICVLIHSPTKQGNR